MGQSWNLMSPHSFSSWLPFGGFFFAVVVGFWLSEMLAHSHLSVIISKLAPSHTFCSTKIILLYCFNILLETKEVNWL